MSPRSPASIEKRQAAFHIREVFDDDPATGQLGVPDRLLTFGDDRLPQSAPGIAQVDRNHFSIRCVAIGAQVQHRTDITERGVFDVVFISHRLDRRANVGAPGIPQIRVVEPVLGPGRLRNTNQKVAAIFADPPADERRGHILSLVNQPVCRLRRAEPVVKERVGRQFGLQRLALGRFRITDEEKPLAVTSSR